MKRWFPFLVLLIASVASLNAETVQEVYARGVRASIGGDNETAKQLFLRVLAADPNNKAAAANLRLIELSAAKNTDLKKRTEALMVPKVDFRDASLNSVLDYLPKVAEQQKGSLNIVRLFPKPYGDEKHITLQLTNMPMSSLLDYIAAAGGLKVTYEKAAIILKLQDSEPAAKPQ
jgi:hypothetical protein